MKSLKVSARLGSPLCGDPPHLDALLELALAHAQGMPTYEIDRSRPCPPVAQIGIPLVRRWINGSLVSCCSSPILSEMECERVEHVNTRFPLEHSPRLSEGERTIVATSNAQFKSYRLPLRIRNVSQIAWFALSGDRRRLLRVLQRNIRSLGKKRSVGYGRVTAWEVDEVSADWSWFATDQDGTQVLMRPLPLGVELPESLTGCRQDFGGCQPPYWHPDRYQEIVVPC